MLSQKIIQFISNLPHFQFDEKGGNYIATRLTDGTVFMPSQVAGDNERGLIYACWQGDCARKTMVIGTQIASLEIVEAVKYWVATGEMTNEQESVKDLFKHFQIKTGERLYIAEDNLMTKQMQKLLKYLGLEAFKKLIGL